MSLRCADVKVTTSSKAQRRCIERHMTIQHDEIGD